MAEMLKASVEAGRSLITQLFNTIIAEKKIPSDYKGKGDATERGNYRGLKLLEYSMKLFERVIEQHIRAAISMDDMQFGNLHHSPNAREVPRQTSGPVPRFH